MNAPQQQQLFDNIAAAIHGVPEDIVRRKPGHFAKGDPACAAGVANAPGLEAWRPLRSGRQLMP